MKATSVPGAATPAAAEELELDAAHLRLAALAWGSDSPRRVLALHGWLDNAASFTPLAGRLGAAHCVALDLPGHGRSQHRPAGAAYHFVDYAAVVLAAADALGWERFSLLGHSLGAAVASLVAAVAPQRVERLALIEGLGPLAADAGEAPQRLLRSLEQTALLAGKRAPVYPDLEAAAHARHAVGGIGAAAARLLAERNSQETLGGVTWRTDPRLRVGSPLFLTEEQVLAFLQRIEAPSLLVRASTGNLHPRAHMPARYACVRDLRIVDVEGGHHVHMDTPEAVAQTLRAFLQT